MGLLSGANKVSGWASGSENAKEGARKSSREQLKAIKEQKSIYKKGYAEASGRIDPAYQAMTGYYTDALGNQISGFQGAYDTGRSDLIGGRDSALSELGSSYDLARGDIYSGLGALESAYGTSRGDIYGGIGALGSAYGTARGDISTSLSAQEAAIRDAQQTGTDLYQPYVQTGQAALGRVNALTTPGDTSFQADPGYAWRVQEGSRGIENSAAGRGGVLGGNTLRALEENRQGLASSEYNNVYNRNLALANMGLSASGATAGLNQWGGTALAGSNQWAGQQNAALAQNYGANTATQYANLANLAQDYGRAQTSQYANLANIATGYGNNAANLYYGTGQNLSSLGQWNAANQASAYGSYAGNMANTENWRTSSLNDLTLGRTNDLASLAGNAGDVRAARESSQAQSSIANKAWWDNKASTAAGGVAGFFGGSGVTSGMQAGSQQSATGYQPMFQNSLFSSSGYY